MNIYTIKKALLLLSLLTTTLIALAQNSSISGTIRDQFTNEPLPFVNILILNTQKGTTTDVNGEFAIETIQNRFVRLQISFLGYKTVITEEIMLQPNHSTYREITLQPASETLKEVKVTANPFAKREESPLSMRRIGVEQIEKSAGANRDISKVLQTYPGVGGTVSFRNDIIVRGGGPSENRFFIDGIEIPNINHFATQGASGGPVGILNVDFIREVEFFSSAFPSSRGNALSSVFEIKQIDGNKDKPIYRLSVGASELAVSANTPISKNTTLIASVRRSYLQFLFSQIGLPFLPTFNDFQFKTKTRFNTKNELTLIGLGALDQFKLNKKAGNTEENRYILGYLPINEQWNYTTGAVFKHYITNGYITAALSRNHLNNSSYKFANNDESTNDNLLYDYTSDEIENKLRLELMARPGKLVYSYGINIESGEYYNNTFQKTYSAASPEIIKYDSELNIIKYGAFGNTSYPFFNSNLTVSLGVRLDGNNYSQEMNNPIDQFSPRISTSLKLWPTLSWNLSSGKYHQLPPYTMLGYRANNTLINKENHISYIESNHFVTGFEYLLNDYTRIELESFFKTYNNYPFSVKDGVSMASKGGNFGVFGDEAVLSNSKGRANGVEFFIQQRNPKGYQYTLAYTYVRSEFTDQDNKYIASTWDSKHLITLTFNQNLKNNWSWGLKWRYVGGLPYTPYDLDKSALVEAWNVQNQAYLDYSKFNQERLSTFHQLDIRIDKTYYFKNFTLGFYIDIQNAYNKKAEQPDNYILSENENGPIIINPEANSNEQKYLLKSLKNTSGTILPTIGLSLVF